ncbi:MAG TPA: hypothetical protein VHO50_00630 [Bacteroidales bacterium]|nr:hypothetical protein [Bacteroidales bacterium]
MRITLVCQFIIFMIFADSCSSKNLKNSKTTPYGVFKYSDVDSELIDDLIGCCKTNLPDIESALNVKIHPETIIEVFPSQAEYDRKIINENLKGSPAISGYGKIQLVSPKAPIRIENIPYKERLWFLIHEYVHLSIDQIDPSLPIFLNEGLACYFGSYNFYKTVVSRYFDKLKSYPSIDQLTDNYDKIMGVDVYSFLFIVFIVRTEGQQNLVTVLRDHQSLRAKNGDWINFLEELKQNSRL